MGLRYRKYIKILPGVRLNISRSGISTRIGPKGFSVNVGKRGTYLNAGIPGTGVFEREKLSTTGEPTERERASRKSREEAASNESPERQLHTNGTLHTNGQAPSTQATLIGLKEKFRHIPLRSIFVFFVTLIIVGFMHRGWVAALWVLGWVSFLSVKLVFAVKQKVEERQAQMPKN